MLTLVANGYVTGEVKAEETDYGRRAVVSIRAKTTNGKQSHFVNATFYGKKIETVTKFMEDGRLVTIVGSVKTIANKTKKDGTEYVAIYMDATDFTLPERQSEEQMPSQRRSTSAPTRNQPQEPDEDDVPF